MTEETPFVVDVERVGRVELHGEGPWSVHEFGRSSYEIIDSNRRSARPTVWEKVSYAPSGNATRPSSNIVWASKSIPNTIVTAANEALAKK